MGSDLSLGILEHPALWPPVDRAPHSHTGHMGSTSLAQPWGWRAWQGVIQTLSPRQVTGVEPSDFQKADNESLQFKKRGNGYRFCLRGGGALTII